jgi:hypothetical protein
MAMPKTAMSKNDCVVAREDDIWLTREPSIVKYVTKARRMQGATQ